MMAEVQERNGTREFAFEKADFKKVQQMLTSFVLRTENPFLALMLLKLFLKREGTNQKSYLPRFQDKAFSER